MTIGLEEGAVVRYNIFERGSVVDEYQSVPEYFKPLPPGDAIALGANPTVVARLTGADPHEFRRIARTAATPEELGSPQELLEQVAGLMGLERRRPRLRRRGFGARRSPGIAPLVSGRVILYDAARCPYCARARIVLAEKGLGYETVEIDLSDRPAWLYAKNPSGTVPVLEEDGGFVLPESLVIMEYLDERFPEPPLWPADPAERCSAGSGSTASTSGSAPTTTRSAAGSSHSSTSGCAISTRRSRRSRSSAAASTASPTSATCPGSCARARTWVSTSSPTRRSLPGSSG